MRTRDTDAPPSRRTPRTPRTARPPRTPRTRPVPRRTVAAISAAAFGIGLAAVLAATHGDHGPGPATSAPSGPTTFTLRGTLTLTPGQYWADSGQCSGNQGYADIAYGDHVVVADQAGQTIGVGQLASGGVHGVGAGQTCVFILGVTVPDGAPFYAVSLAGRGSQTFTAEQAKAGIALSLG